MLENMIHKLAEDPTHLLPGLAAVVAGYLLAAAARALLAAWRRSRTPANSCPPVC